MNERAPSALQSPSLPWVALVAALVVVAVLVVRASLELWAQGYGLFPPTPSAWSVLAQSARMAWLAGAAVAVAIAIPWLLAVALRRSPRTLATFWSLLLAGSLWAWHGYHYNRYTVAALWKQRTSVGGFQVPRALVDADALSHNIVVSVAALALALVLAWLLTRYLQGLRSRSTSRAVGGLALVLLALTLPLLSGVHRVFRPDPSGPDVLLISLDAVRADRLGCYGYERDITPALDSLAAESVMYTRAYCQEPWTLTSHMSMLTSLYPDVHGLDFGRGLSKNVWTVTERLRDAGYRTWASVYDCFFLDRRFGYDAGFDHYEVSGIDAQTRCQQVADWLTGGSRSAFAFLHLYDPHSDTGDLPYEAPAAFLQQWAPGDAELLRDWVGDVASSEALRGVNQGQRALPDSLRASISRLYDAGLAATDAALGRLFQQLKDAGRWDDMLVIVLADHGEALGEADHYMHERMMEATLRIPLLVKWPGARDAGTVVEDLTETVDIAPTLLSVAGLPQEAVRQGRELGGVLAPARRASFHRSGPDYALTTDNGWRIHYRWSEEAPSFLALHAVGSDPSDGPDLLATESARIDSWLDTIWSLHRANDALARRFRGGEVLSTGADEALLRSLGYIE